MAAKKPQVPAYAKSGVWVFVLGHFYPFTEISEKVEIKEEKLGKRVLSREEIVTEIDPYWVFSDFRKPDTITSGIAGIAGNLDTVGDVYLVLDGKLTPLPLKPGLTGKEGALVKRGPNKGQEKTRNPKLDLGEDEVFKVTFRGQERNVTFGVSCQENVRLYLWGGVRNPAKATEGRKYEKSAPMDVSALAAFVPKD